MLEFRIPGAELLFALVVLVGFIIALVSIHSTDATRARALGTAGVVLVGAGTVIAALIGSIAVVYGTESGISVGGTVAAVVLLAVGIVFLLLSLVLRRAHGAARVLGAISLPLIGIGVASRFVFQWTGERYLGQVRDATIISIMAAEIAIGGLLLGLGLVLVSRAIVSADRH